MKLKDYIESRRFETKEFAEMVGCKSATICNYIAGRRKPDIEIVEKIEEITKGKVTLEDLIQHWREKNG